MATISEKVDAQAAAIKAINDKLDTILAHPVVSDNSDLKAQLTAIQNDLGDVPTVTATDTGAGTGTDNTSGQNS